MPPGVIDRLERHWAAGELLTCAQFLLEAGYSARSAADHARVVVALRRLEHVPLGREIEDAAMAAQQELAASGHHRVAPSDLLIAACAHVHGAGVLHYDKDFDIIAERTSLRYDSEWLVPRGEL